MTEDVKDRKKIEGEFRCPDCGLKLFSFKELIEHQKICGNADAVATDSSEPFVHLHVHSEYSILDGVGEIKGLAKRAGKIGAKALAITDHGTISGHIAFQQACQSVGVKPIFGCEFYISEDMLNKTKEGRKYHHLLILAKNEVGYKNLRKLASIAATEGFYYKPRIDFHTLSKHAEGLICTSACIGGEISQAILKDKEYFKACDIATKYKELFGEDFYLEIQPNRIPHQITVNKIITNMSKELNIPLIATNDAHYPNPEDWMAHEVVLCIKSRSSIKDPKRFKFDDNTFYLMTAEEMKTAFVEHHPDIDSVLIDGAMDNSLSIMDKCDYTIVKKDVVLPTPPIADGMTESEFFEDLAWKGMKMPYLHKKMSVYATIHDMSFEEAEQVYKDRLIHEIAVIQQLGFERYFLIVWGMYNHCRENNIYFGPGRGSVAGSLAAYAVGITTVDPIENDLLFSRFLSPERIDYPDIDMDFEDARRHEVVQYLKDTYGEDCVSNIVTYGRMKGKSVLKDVARVFDVPYEDVNRVTDFIVQRSGGDARVSFTVEDAIESFTEVKEFAEKYPETIQYSKRLEGMIRQKGVHAAGIVVSEDPISEICPVEMKDGTLLTSFDGVAAENAGLLKLDVLGLRTMSIIGSTVDKIALSTGNKIVLEEIPLDDSEVFRLFSEGRSAGVFQLETPNMTKLTRQVGVDKFDDVVLINALGRPGTMRSGLSSKLVRIKHNKEKASYLHEMMRPITEPTFSILLYQEQIMRVLADIGNFDWSAVDIHRKIISKSQGTAAFEKAREKFVKGAMENGIEDEEAHKLYTQMIQFGSYSFNKSHAAAYSTISYWCMWFKVHYPNEFFASALSNANGKEQEYIREARKLGVEFLSPDINKSEEGFSIEEGQVRCGLNGIIGLGEKGIKKIIESRPFKDLTSFTKKLPGNKVNKKSVEALIRVGAFCDPLHGGAQMLDDYLLGRDPGQKTLFDFCDSGDVPQLAEWNTSEVEQFKSEYYILPPINHPIEKHLDFLKTLECGHDFTLMDEVSSGEISGGIYTRGIITEVKYQNWGDKLSERPTPDHPKYRYYSKFEWNSRHCIFDLEDESGFALISVDPILFAKFEHLINKGYGTEIIVKGNLWSGSNRIQAEAIWDIKDLKTSVDSGSTLSKLDQMIVDNPLRKYEHMKKVEIANLDGFGAVIGILGKPKVIKDKNDRDMAFVTLSDMTGDLSLTFFADDWATRQYELEEGKIYGMAVKAMPKHGDFKTSYTVSKIIDMETTGKV